MKSGLIFMFGALALVAAGCSINLKRSDLLQGRRYFAREQEIEKFKSVNGMPAKEPYETKAVKVGDSFEAYAFVSGSNAMGGDFTMMYLTVENGDSIWVSGKRIVDEDEWECLGNGGKVTIPKSEGDDAWGRATVFVNKHSDMKIQVASDNIIDTYNPTKPGYRGYTITRRSSGDNVIIEIEVKGSSALHGQCDAYEYIKYGR